MVFNFAAFLGSPNFFFGGGGVTGIPIKNPPTDEIFEE